MKEINNGSGIEAEAERLARHIFMEPIRQNFFVDQNLPELERFKQIMEGVIQEGKQQISTALFQAIQEERDRILKLIDEELEEWRGDFRAIVQEFRDDLVESLSLDGGRG